MFIAGKFIADTSAARDGVGAEEGARGVAGYESQVARVTRDTFTNVFGPAFCLGNEYCRPRASRISRDTSALPPGAPRRRP